MTGTVTPTPLRRTGLDEADLVLVASAACGQRPEQVLASCDVAALASVVAAAEHAPSGLDAAAVVVVEFGRRRPFARGNAAAAWLAAAHLLTGDGLRLRIGPTTARTVFAASDDLDATVVRAVLVEHIEPSRSLVGRVLRSLFGPRTLDGPGVFRCPACDRPLVQRRGDLVAAGPWVDSARIERVARCAVEHGAHGRRARPSSHDQVAVGA
jgi:hypothetical protein